MPLKIRFHKGEKRIDKSIEEVTDTEGKASIGRLSGTGLAHCIYLGCRCHENFFDEVKYYRFCSREESPSLDRYSTTVEFYKDG